MTRRLPHRAYLAIGRFSRTRVVRRFHPALYHRFHGAAVLGHVLGCRTIVLHTTGARTGQPRAAALFAFAVPEAPGAAPVAGENRAFAVVASNGGAGHPPAWYHNLVAHGEGVVEDGSRRWAARARVAEGAERTRLWAVITATYPGYDDYQARTPDVIPVVVLEPVAVD